MKHVYNHQVVPFPGLATYRSESDGCLVTHVDTEGIPENEQGPIIRLYLNDEVVFENPPLENAEPSQAKQFETFGREVACILENDQEWNADTLDDIVFAANACKIALKVK